MRVFNQMFREIIPYFCSNTPLTITPEGQAVAPPVVGPPGGTSLVGRVALGAQSPVALAGRGKAAQLTVLVDGVADPVHAGVLKST